MKREIVTIDADACTGCGLCVEACHEGAIAMVDGKAVLLRDDYCDGLGDCLPACPADAITIEVREAAAYDEEAVAAKMQTAHAGGCPSARFESFDSHADAGAVPSSSDTGSALDHWPCQIRLVPASAPCFAGADLLIAADCTAFSCGDFHARFMAGRCTVMGCPKLDPVDYAEKLTDILTQNDIRSVTVALMEVPCCNGLGSAVERAIEASGKSIPCTTHIVGTDGMMR